MALNIARFKADLEKLIRDSDNLELALLVKAHGANEISQAIKQDADEAERHKLEADLKKLPAFGVAYEAWYSEGLALIRQILPDRLADFKEHFEASKNRKDITYASYRIQDALKDLKVTRPPYDDVIVDSKASIPHLRQQMAILMAAEKRFKSSLFEIRQLVQADLFDTEIASARHLLKNKFLRAAGAIAGVVLEKHLVQVCEDHQIKITKKNPGINDLNQILRDASLIDVPQWRYITMLGDIRNICDHSKQKEPNEQQVIDLIDGVDKVLKTVS